MTQPVSEESQLNAVRAAVYNLLSRLVAMEVDEELVRELGTEDVQSLLNYFAQLGEFKPHVNTINTYLAKLSDEGYRLELAADYCTLFLMDGKHGVSLYASQYLSSDASDGLFGEIHHEMTAVLSKSQLAMSSDFPEPADHLAVLLAYMSQICDHEPEVQADFLTRYLGSWLNTFKQQLDREDDRGFYAAVGALIAHWCDLDAEVLKS